MSRRSLVLALVLGGAAAGLAAPEHVATVPIGLTDLLQDPACTVGYQFDGKEPRSPGWRWTGYDPESGVYFTPEVGEGNRPQLFMHSPGRGGPGVAFADYRLRLPKAGRITLAVQTAIRASAPNSDGVTYRVSADGEVLWEAHCTWKRWQDATVDLSRLAGREVTLRLEVDPGPQRNSTDDWSLWGRAEIAAGTDAELAAARARQAKELA